MSLQQLPLKNPEAGSKVMGGVSPPVGRGPHPQTSKGQIPSSWHCWKYLEDKGDWPGAGIYIILPTGH